MYDDSHRVCASSGAKIFFFSFGAIYWFPSQDISEQTRADTVNRLGVRKGEGGEGREGVGNLRAMALGQRRLETENDEKQKQKKEAGMAANKKTTSKRVKPRAHMR